MQTKKLKTKPKKKIRYIVLSIVLAILLLIAFLIFATPVPTSLFIRKMFENPTQTPPAQNNAAKNPITILDDIAYTSNNKTNVLDLYLPEGKNLPVVLWVHGGAFVGGDKKDCVYYAKALAQQGYAVVTMNYELAPEAKYPTQLLQIGEVYEWLREVEQTYALNLSKLFFAGDSAGAHMAAQFACIQTSKDYSQKIGIRQTVAYENIKGLLLYCGPYDTQELLKYDTFLMKYLARQISWAYFGDTKGFSTFDDEVNILKNINENFPPVFITDGNTGSFEEHGKALQNVLENKNLIVESYFIPLSEEKTMHEYQFQMHTPAGEKSFEKTILFLKKYST